MKFCFLDLETTGFEPEEDSIIEMSFIVQDENGKTLETVDEVIIPEKSELTPFITHITGISLEEITHKGRPLGELKAEATAKIGDAIIVGHNIDFDIGFLVSNGIDVSQNKRIDTHELARILLVNEESYALEILAEKYEFAHTSAHRAMSDVEASLELFTFLKQKIGNLPPEFLEGARSFLETKTDWYAKYLFLESRGDDKFHFERDPLPTANPFDVSDEFWKKFEEISPSHSLFIKQGESIASSELATSVAQSLADKGEEVLIISSKLGFFPSVKKFPIPEVLFDAKRLGSFAEERGQLDNKETTFYLKCLYRHILGFRGLDSFNLFFQERTLWKEVQIVSEESSIFQGIVQEKSSEKILSISPQAFFRFKDLELFQDRVLIIDESEFFAEKLLFAPATEVSLFDYLNSKDENVATKAHFFVANFCKEVIEPSLQHAMTPFPEKILLKKRESLPHFAESLRELNNEGPMEKVAEWLENPPEQSTRWAKYFPETGNLNFGLWHPDDWRDMKSFLGKFRKIFFHRHEASQSNQFFRVFIGAADGEFVIDERLLLKKKIIIPPNLISANDPEFNSYCAKKIMEKAREMVDENNFLAVNFSSQETLKKVFFQVSESFLEEELEVIGEKMSGGDGKVLQLLSMKNKVVLLTQKFLYPELAQYPFKTLFVQKFPFPGPHPLLKEIENVMKQSGQNFWSAWIVPQVTANLSRRVSMYPQAKEVIWLDPRQNSRWGKGILKDVFS